MITPEERQEIIDAAVEKALLMLPDVIGNLITSHAQMLRLNRTFYEKYPDFAKRKDIVASIVEKIESDNPGTDYSKILELAVPTIKDRLKTVSKLDTTSVSRPNRTLIDISPSDHGEL